MFQNQIIELSYYVAAILFILGLKLQLPIWPTFLQG